MTNPFDAATEQSPRARRPRANFNPPSAELADFLRDASSWSSFAASLAGTVEARGGLSDKQLAAAESMMAQTMAKRAEAKAVAASVDASPIFELMDAYRKVSVLADGDLTAKRVKSGQNLGGVYVREGGIYIGKATRDGFVSREAVDAVRKLSGLAMNALLSGDVVTFLGAHGRETGICCVCGTELTAPESVERGIGPICAGKFS